MDKQAGFNLIEFLAALAVLALLAALAIPRFADDRTQVLQTTREDTKNAVKSAHSIAIAKLKDFPSVAQLERYIENDRSFTATGDGLYFEFDNNGYTVLTYTDADCSMPTGDIDDPVLCVGTITP